MEHKDYCTIASCLPLSFVVRQKVAEYKPWNIR